MAQGETRTAKQTKWTLFREKLMLCQLWSWTKFHAGGRTETRKDDIQHITFFPLKARKVSGIQGNGQVRQYGRWVVCIGKWELLQAWNFEAVRVAGLSTFEEGDGKCKVGRRGGKRKENHQKVRETEGKEWGVCVDTRGDIKDYQYHVRSLNGKRDVINLPRLSDLITIFPSGSYDERPPKQKHRRAATRLIFVSHLQRLSHAGELKPHTAFLPHSWQHHWQWEKLAENVKRLQAASESVTVTHWVSQAIISKCSQLMSDGGKQNTSPTMGENHLTTEVPENGEKKVLAPMGNLTVTTTITV